MASARGETAVNHCTACPLRCERQGRGESPRLDALGMDALAAERAAERVEGEPQGNYEELGFSYAAYPKAAVFFYNSKELGEGNLEIGCTSAAQLMYEWTDDDTLHLYVDNPENGDGGDYSITLE